MGDGEQLSSETNLAPGTDTAKNETPQAFNYDTGEARSNPAPDARRTDNQAQLLRKYHHLTARNQILPESAKSHSVSVQEYQEEYGTVVVTQQVLTVNPYGCGPASVRCRYCHEDIVTNVEHKITIETVCKNLPLCIFLPVMLYCIFFNDFFKQSIHTCPKCNQELGRWH